VEFRAWNAREELVGARKVELGDSGEEQKTDLKRHGLPPCEVKE
jgi:hypothetical protein